MIRINVDMNYHIFICTILEPNGNSRIISGNVLYDLAKKIFQEYKEYAIIVENSMCGIHLHEALLELGANAHRLVQKTVRNDVINKVEIKRYIIPNEPSKEDKMTAKKAKQVLQNGKWWEYLEFPDNSINPETDVDYAIEFHDALDTACYALACMEQFKNLTEG